MFVIGTAGHVDHGKSLLVERLTGIDPDRLREEKARGMTIDLGFAWLTLPSGRAVSIVDVPGHERFIKNMLAGAGGIDLALLVVAADDGVMPQTREHLAILDLLDVNRGVVALTKTDLADDAWVALVRADIEELLRGTTLEGSPIVLASSVTGAGLNDLLAALDAAIDALPPKRNIDRPRLPIDRVFTIGGFGTVVTGTLVDGTLVTGQDIEVMPGGARGRIRGLQTHKDKMDRALPGTRTAVNVTGIERHSLRRGMVLAAPGEAHEARLIDALVRVVRGAVHPLRHGMRVSFHCLADESNAQVRLLEKDLLGAGEQGWATIRLETPVAALRGDRFVLRTASDTIAGGVIVDTAPRRHRRRDPAVIEALTALLSERPADVIYAAVERHPGASLSDTAGSLSNEDAATAVRELTGAGRIVLLGGEPLLVTATFEERSRKEALSALAAYHAEHPLRVGMPVEELRSRLKLERHLLDRLLDRWSDVSTRATSAALTGFRPTLSAEQQQAADALLAALREAPFNPPATEGVDASILGYLEAAGVVVDAGAGVVFAREAFDEMRQRVEAHIRVHGSITLAQARDEFGTSRRYVQSLLEHLDRLRVTMRRGDERVLR